MGGFLCKCVCFSGCYHLVLCLYLFCSGLCSGNQFLWLFFNVLGLVAAYLGCSDWVWVFGLVSYGLCYVVIFWFSFVSLLPLGICFTYFVKLLSHTGDAITPGAARQRSGKRIFSLMKTHRILWGA